MPKINPRLATMLAQPERVVEPRHEVPGLLEDVAPAELSQIAERLIVTHAAGEALEQARRQRALSLRGAGAVSGRSAPRIKAIEATHTDIHLGTVVEHAGSLGYAVELILTPLDGMGAVVRAELGEQAPAASADAVLAQQMDQMQAELAAMHGSAAKAPAKKAPARAKKKSEAAE